MKIRQLLAGLSMLAVSSALVAGCSPGSNDEDTTKLTVAYFNDVSSLDPIKGTAGHDHVMLYPMYDTLLNFTESLEPTPGLAEAWEQTEPDQLTLTLRGGVKFHDGTEMDAEAVKYNLDRARGEGSNIASDLADISEVRAVDGRTVVIDLDHPNTSLLLVLADRGGMMVSPAADPESLATNPVGTGPWKFESYTRGSTLRMSKFEDYWNTETDVVDELRFTILTDEKTRTTALQSGQADIAFNVSSADVESLEGQDGIEILAAQSQYLPMILIDTSSSEFEDVRIRHALSYAIDREKIVKSINFGFAEPASTFLPSQHWAFNDELEYPYDPEKAKALLTEAGHPDGFSFTMLTSTTNTRTAELIADDWAKVGVKVTLEPMETNAAIAAYIEQRRHPIFLLAWSGRPDPATSLDALLNANSIYSVSKEEIPMFAESIAEANSTGDQAGRAAAVRRAEKAAFDFAPIIPLTHEYTLIGHRANISGMTLNLLGKPRLSEVVVE